MERPQARSLQQLPPLQKVFKPLLPDVKLNLQLPKRKDAVPLLDAPSGRVGARGELCARRWGVALPCEVLNDRTEGLPFPPLHIQSQEVNMRMS